MRSSTISGAYLTVGMNDREDTCAQVKPPLETGFLSPAVALVDLMMDDVKPGPLISQTFGHFAGIVGTLIIDHNGDAIVPKPNRNAPEHR